MKQPSFMLSVVIDDPKGPGNKIDVFLQSLVDELKELWHTGVSTYDASCGEMFQLHAGLLWTISDFPGYSNISDTLMMWKPRKTDHLATTMEIITWVEGYMEEQVPADCNEKGPPIVKKGRGCAQFPKGWGTEKKLEVTLDRNQRVIGPDVNHYKTSIGCMARIGVKLPLNYVEFNHIPEYLRDMAWEEVEVGLLFSFMFTFHAFMYC
ncbi:hypothetical protein Salat_2769300 [Sesamum alatum]|uniref:Uncharacterized protein n=1 Tax=Sesamum alatum TaxID=300844 RepID=A0AAE1XLI7_9LAMI|nr:hypothetical protein Salat_2769300 [Sesamum alatum]